MRNIVLAVLMAATFLMPAYAQNPFVEEKTKAAGPGKEDIKLLGQALPPIDGKLPGGKKVQREWQVRGRIDDWVILINSAGETKTVLVGSEIDGCIVTVDALICDPAGKKELEKKSWENVEIAHLKALVSEQEISLRAAERREADLAGMSAKKEDEINKLHANIAALETKVKSLEVKLSNRELASKKGPCLPDLAWTEANVENIGNVMCADAGMAGIIMKVDQTNVKKAEAVLKGSIRNKQEQGNYAYFTLSKDMLQIEEAGQHE